MTHSTHLTDGTLRRKIWLDAAISALLDYRPPGTAISDAEQHALLKYMDSDVAPEDAAERHQAARKAP